MRRESAFHHVIASYANSLSADADCSGVASSANACERLSRDVTTTTAAR